MRTHWVNFEPTDNQRLDIAVACYNNYADYKHDGSNVRLEVVGTECSPVDNRDVDVNYCVMLAVKFWRSNKVHAVIADVSHVDVKNGKFQVTWRHENEDFAPLCRVSKDFLSKLTRPMTESAARWRINAATFGL